MLLIHHPIPVVGEITAITILSEIGDIHNFNSSKQLVAYAGIDPSVHQSGSYTARNSKNSKRGTPYLRKALYQATVAGISKRKTGPVNLLLLLAINFLESFTPCLLMANCMFNNN